MKKLLTFSTLCIFAGLLLSSCSSNVSIVKRHYRSGYYVDYTKKAPSVNYVSAKPERKAEFTSISSPELRGVPEQYIAVNNQIPTTLINIPASKKATLLLKHSIANAKQAFASPFTIDKTATSVTKSTPVFAYDGSAGYDDGAGAALSLLWIVIVVILIIWLLGLLAGGWGLGGLINLLLIIAVILLILWLLRIA